MKTMCAKCGASMKKGGTSQKMKKGGITQEIVGMPGYNATIRPMTMKSGGSTSRAVKHSCPPGTVRSASGGCVSQRPSEFKNGGSTFGMLSVKAGVDKNPNPTAADRIAGAKMNKKRNGGTVAPSSGLTKKQKSSVAKKASAGKDIGKKGKGFAKIAASAGGGEKGKRIAAAAMWKNIKRG